MIELGDEEIIIRYVYVHDFSSIEFYSMTLQLFDSHRRLAALNDNTVKASIDAAIKNLTGVCEVMGAMENYAEIFYNDLKKNKMSLGSLDLSPLTCGAVGTFE